MKNIKIRVFNTHSKALMYSEDKNLSFIIDDKGFISVLKSDKINIGDEKNSVINLFSGLKDKNGKDIYEDDKLQRGNGEILEVEFCAGAFYAGQFLLSTVNENCINLGHIICA